ncbi:hypothetical protein [Vulcanisaeta sp. JCM 16159]
MTSPINAPMGLPPCIINTWSLLNCVLVRLRFIVMSISLRRLVR